MVMGGLLHLVQLGGAWAGCGPAQSPPRYIKCNSPPINGQCTSHHIIRCTTIITDGPLKGTLAPFFKLLTFRLPPKTRTQNDDHYEISAHKPISISFGTQTPEET